MTQAPPALDLRGIGKSYGHTRVLEGVDLAVAPGEFLTLVGASGCGKSTLLRIIAGLEAQDAGTVAIGGRTVDDVRPKQRNVAMVFQSYALYPHMTVADNIAMPLVMDRLRLMERLPLLGALSPRRRATMRQIDAEVAAVARQLEIGALLARKPGQLSGGQRQRVALGRAMVRSPAIFLMDEPLSNLDARLRVHMRAELAELHRRLGATFVYVTHDQTEAMTMSSRVAMMDEGRIVQLGTPDALYHDPGDLRVARFIGAPGINVFPGESDGTGIAVLGLRLPLVAPPGPVQVGVRPEALAVTPRAAEGRIAARLRHAENLGAEFLLHLECGPAIRVVARLTVEAFQALRREGVDGMLGLVPSMDAVLLFDQAGRRLRPTLARMPVAQAAG